MGKKKKIILALAALVAVAAVLTGVYLLTRQPAQAGLKHITVKITVNESERTAQIDTEQEMLGAALTDEKIIEGEQGPYGLYVTAVDGYTADEGAQEWWCFTKGGEELSTGVDQTPIADGDQFEITLKTGW
jgi:hypothetical protein